MSDNNQTQHRHAIYFGEKLTSEYDKARAISGFARDLRKYHWALADHTIHGNGTTPGEQPVITGTFLPAELGMATSRGLRFEEINKPAVQPALAL